MISLVLKNASLVELVKERALQLGDFELSSGVRSNYFIDMSKVTNFSTGLDMITMSLLFYLEGRDWRCDSVGGPELGAVPMVGGLLVAYSRHHYSQTNMRGFAVRKQPKNGSYIEGDLRPGDNVLVVEDVVTTGNQTRQACEAVERAGGVVRGVVAVVDRLAGAAETLAKWDFQSLMTIQDLGVNP